VKVHLKDLPPVARASAINQLARAGGRAAPEPAPLGEKRNRKTPRVRAAVFCTRCASYEHGPNDAVKAEGMPAEPKCRIARVEADIGARLPIFAVAVRTENVSNGSHGHWSGEKKRRDLVKAAIDEGWVAAKIPVRPRLLVRLVRISSSKLDRDDNLRLALKSVKDSVAAQLKVDDESPLVEWAYGQERGAPGKPAVRIEIEDLR
jgi:hypothetical protein